jgi:hypothetical protein
VCHFRSSIYLLCMYRRFWGLNIIVIILIGAWFKFQGPISRTLQDRLEGLREWFGCEGKKAEDDGVASPRNPGGFTFPFQAALSPAAADAAQQPQRRKKGYASLPPVVKVSAQTAAADPAVVSPASSLSSGSPPHSHHQMLQLNSALETTHVHDHGVQSSQKSFDNALATQELRRAQSDPVEASGTTNGTNQP